LKESSKRTKTQIKSIAILTYLVLSSPVWGIGAVGIYSAFKAECYTLGAVWLVLGVLCGAAKLCDADFFIDLEMNMDLKKK